MQAKNARRISSLLNRLEQ